uniref:Uncharacterized protein n=1 Tax=Amphora coffeiformis TaxID=265554 RepID=A0A7S3LG56_9STRA
MVLGTGKNIISTIYRKRWPIFKLWGSSTVGGPNFLDHRRQQKNGELFSITSSAHLSFVLDAIFVSHAFLKIQFFDQKEDERRGKHKDHGSMLSLFAQKF